MKVISEKKEYAKPESVVVPEVEVAFNFMGNSDDDDSVEEAPEGSTAKGSIWDDGLSDW